MVWLCMKEVGGGGNGLIIEREKFLSGEEHESRLLSNEYLPIGASQPGGDTFSEYF